MKKLAALASIALLIAAFLFGIDFYRHRFVRRGSDLARLLPQGDVSLIYIDLAALRNAHLIDLFKNIQVAPDENYKSFVNETGFDYTRDLDAVALAIDSQQTFLLGLGHLPWSKLKSFAVSHHGKCSNGTCRVPATAPGRWISFFSIQSNVIAAAVSADESAANKLRPPGGRTQVNFPDAPLWARPSRAILANPGVLPLPLQIFAIGLQSSRSVFLFAQLQNLHLKAHFENAAAAEMARRQLELETKVVRGALKDGNDQTDRSALAGLLKSGSFQVIGTDVLGEWRIYPELLQALR